MPWIIGVVSHATLAALRESRADVVVGDDAIAELASPYEGDMAGGEQFVAVYIESTIEELTPLIVRS